ncbi:hypothetical protein M0R45_017039 [Rubus argutus]|uniref:Uncharacterized protein n=1 Tax=Rubus argutus TaxID=59490 RepID=A0AAW1XWA5_RUBAR
MTVDATSIVIYRPLKDLNGIPGANDLIVCLTGYQGAEVCSALRDWVLLREDNYNKRPMMEARDSEDEAEDTFIKQSGAEAWIRVALIYKLVCLFLFEFQSQKRRFKILNTGPTSSSGMYAPASIESAPIVYKEYRHEIKFIVNWYLTSLIC